MDAPRRPPCRRLARAAAGLLAAVIVLVALAVAVGPRTGRYQTLTILSGSMAPHFPAGSIVVVVPAAIEDLRVGDVISYAIPVGDRRVVTHRVIEIAESGASRVFRTQGDANADPDPWQAELHGPAWRVAGGVRGVGTAITWAHGTVGSVVLRVLLPVLFALVSIIDLWRRPRLQAATLA